MRVDGRHLLGQRLELLWERQGLFDAVEGRSRVELPWRNGCRKKHRDRPGQPWFLSLHWAGAGNAQQDLQKEENIASAIGWTTTKEETERTD